MGCVKKYVISTTLIVTSTCTIWVHSMINSKYSNLKQESSPEIDALLLFNDNIRNSLQSFRAHLFQMQTATNLHGIFNKLTVIRNDAKKLRKKYAYFYRQHPDLQQYTASYLVPIFNFMHGLIGDTCTEINNFFDTPHLEELYRSEHINWLEPLIDLSHIIYVDLINNYQRHLISEEDFIVCTEQQQALDHALERSPMCVPDYS